MAPAILAYWDIRGLAQPIRLLLEYSGMPWEDKHYLCGPAPTYDKTNWLQEKESLGLDFPNLPYFIDGDVKLTQSAAILQYIARKQGLAGETEEEKQRIDLIQGELGDIKSQFTSMCYNPNFESMKPAYLENVPVKLNRLGKFLGDNPFFAGKNVSYVDFIAYEILDQHKIMEPTILSKNKNLEDFTSRIENLKHIDGYMKSDRFIQLKDKLNGRMAAFGGEDSKK